MMKLRTAALVYSVKLTVRVCLDELPAPRVSVAGWSVGSSSERQNEPEAPAWDRLQRRFRLAVFLRPKEETT